MSSSNTIYMPLVHDGVLKSFIKAGGSTSSDPRKRLNQAQNSLGFQNPAMTFTRPTSGEPARSNFESLSSAPNNSQPNNGQKTILGG